MSVETVNYFIPVLTPLVIAAVKLAVPRIPKAVLPVAAPVLGAAAEVVGYYTGVLTTVDPLRGAVLGALGLWLREVVDQTKKALVGE